MFKRNYFYRLRVWRDGMWVYESGVLQHQSLRCQPVVVVGQALNRGAKVFDTSCDKVEITTLARL